ncbi:MAG: DNA-3-methyladenine glycosylase family protein [Acidimicrobiales bacterium]
MSAPLTPQEIAVVIGERDRAFRRFIKDVGPPPPRRSAPVAQRFPMLARAITGQLLATKAATTIHQRVVDLCEGDVNAESIQRVGHANLRNVGLSNGKAAAMLDLAERTLDGRVRLAHHGKMSDSDVLGDVVAVRGIGPWTAQMYLMHTLARHDVWPSGDLGVRHGWSRLHGHEELVSQGELQRKGDRFEGVRSDVAWYCWQVIRLQRAQ